MDFLSSSSSSLPATLASTVVVAVSAHILSSYLSNTVRNRRFVTFRSSSSCHNHGDNGNNDDGDVVVAAVEPPQVFSWIPFVGSGVEMGRGIVAFIRKYSQQFNSPIFSAVVGGKVCHFFADSEDATIGFLPTRSLDNKAIGQQFLCNAAGASQDAVNVAYEDKPKVKQINSLLHKHLMTKDAKASNVDASQRVLNQRFRILDQKISSSADEDGGSWYQTSLFDFVSCTIFAAAVGPLIGHGMATDEAAKHFLDWDNGIPLLFGGVPATFLKKSVTGRERLAELIMSSKFFETSSDLTKGRRMILREGVDDEIYLRGLLGVVFASSGNSIPSVFWTMAHVLSDREALEAVVRESRSFQPDPQTGLFTIEQLDRMVVIKSVWNEAIRLYLQQFTGRDIVKDIEYTTKTTGQCRGQTYLLKAGTRIMSTVLVRHHDPDIFENPDEFKWDKFVPDPITGTDPVFTTKHGHVIDEPVSLFGGGAHKCPGRFFIEYEMKSFLANVFSKYDIRLADGEGIPKSLEVETGVGIVAPAGDMMIELTKKKST